MEKKYRAFYSLCSLALFFLSHRVICSTEDIHLGAINLLMDVRIAYNEKLGSICTFVACRDKVINL